MKEEPKADMGSIEGDKPRVTLSYQYKDAYGRLFGTFESEGLHPLLDPPSDEARYFDGSIETPYGDFVLECTISEAKKILASLADFIRTKEELRDVEMRLTQARSTLDAGHERWRSVGNEPDYTAYRLVEDLQRKKFQLETKSKACEKLLEKYRT